MISTISALSCYLAIGLHRIEIVHKLPVTSQLLLSLDIAPVRRCTGEGTPMELVESCGYPDYPLLSMAIEKSACFISIWAPLEDSIARNV